MGCLEMEHRTANKKDPKRIRKGCYLRARMGWNLPFFATPTQGHTHTRSKRSDQVLLVAAAVCLSLSLPRALSPTTTAKAV